MREADLNNVIDNQKTGLTIVDVRTGFSKTYTSLLTIAKRASKKQRYIFITNKKNNIPWLLLRNIFKILGKEALFDEEVLFVKSYADAVIDRLPTINDVPNEFKTDIYFSLLKNIKEYNESKNKKDINAQNALEKIRGIKGATGLEKEYRDEIENSLSKIVANTVEGPLTFNEKKQKKMDLIRNNKKYSWIQKLYPEVFIKDYPILLMTTAKFFSYYDTIVGKKQLFISSELVNGSVIIIDEIDQTKKVFLDNIIDNSVNESQNYFEEFISFYDVLFITKVSERLSLNDEMRQNIKRIKAKYTEIMNKYLPDHNWFLNQDRNKRNLIFFDGNFISYLGNEKDKRMLAEYDEDNKEVKLKKVPIDEYFNQRDSSIDFWGMIREITSFMRKLSNYFTIVAKTNMEIYNSKSKSPVAISYEDELFSVMHAYKLRKEQIDLMLSLQPYFQDNIKIGINGIDDFYDHGFVILQFLNSDMDLNNTQFNFFRINMTPEKILNYLANKSHVIGLSATASVNSNLCNYDLNYLRKSLGDKLVFISNLLSKETKSRYKTLSTSYENHGITVKIEDFLTLYGNIRDHSYSSKEDINEILNDVLNIKNPDIRTTKTIGERANDLYSSSLSKNQKTYILNRYFEVIQTFVDFFEDKNSMSFLGLTMKLPKKDDPSFDLTLLKNIYQLLNEKYKVKSKLVILQSDNFEKAKYDLLNDLSKGQKIYVLSTYQSIGDGQNLQYKPSKKDDDLIRIVERDFTSTTDKRLKTKDFDGMYLGDITYITENLFDEKFTKKNLFNYLMQIEYLSKSADISADQKKNLIELGLKRYVTGHVESNGTTYFKLKSTPSGRKKILQQIIQATGRLNRTFNKRKNIHIFVSPNILKELPLEELNNINKKYMLSEEMKKIFEVAERKQKKVNQNDNNVQLFRRYGNNVLNLISSSSMADKKIGMIAYENLREYILKHPTASREVKNSIYGDFYEKYNEQNKYLISTNSATKESQYVEITDESITLATIMKIPELKSYFEQKEYATEFKKNDYVINSIMAKDYYRAELGEVAGVFLIKKYLNKNLQRLQDSRIFELFDYYFGDDIFFDFKNFGSKFDLSAEEYLLKTSEKLTKVGGKRAFIINLISDNTFSKITRSKNKKVIVIPRLMSTDAIIDMENIKQMGAEIDDIY